MIAIGKTHRISRFKIKKGFAVYKNASHGETHFYNIHGCSFGNMSKYCLF